MSIPDAAVDLIKRYEGCRLEAYRCPRGVWTIGYGHVGGIREGQTITQAEADAMLARDLDYFADGVRRLVRVPITQGQLGALVSLAYNIGLGALARSTLLRKLNASDYDGARAEFGQWVNAGGQRILGLVKRRHAEQELWGL